MGKSVHNEETKKLMEGILKLQSVRVGCYPTHISYPDLLAAPLLISPRLCMALLEKSAHFLLGQRMPLPGRGYCYRRHKS